jgi:hypothetical protein
MRKPIFITTIAISVILLVLVLMPVNTSAENSVKVTGIVQTISEGGVKDLVFKLENNKGSYYINRGLENGFTLEKSKKDLIGKKVILFYAKNWTPLAPFGSTCKHITHFVANDSVLFSEWK